MKLVLATSNPAKVRRLEWMLDGLPLEVVKPAPLAVTEGVVSICENALIKAKAYSATYSERSIATDGGLLVPSVPEWNPAETGRNGPNRLLDLMQGLKNEQRRARQIECVAVVDQFGANLGLLEATSAPRYVAQRFAAKRTSDGFWLPGLLIYPDGASIDDHWLDLRSRLRALVVAEISRVDPPGSPRQ
jgi:hypothetical protein